MDVTFKYKLEMQKVKKFCLNALLAGGYFIYKLLSPLVCLVLPLNKKIKHVRKIEGASSNWSFRDTHYAVLDCIGLIHRHDGYTAEDYRVVTDDKYILKLHRITASPNFPKAKHKPVVLLQHGFALSSDCWVFNGPDKDLAFMLADAGKDVWLGNFRGNTYCQSHDYKQFQADEFWDFRIDELAIYDLKATIDRILEETKSKTLTYYGFSMGTTTIFMLLSKYPQYNSKIDLLFCLSPVVFWRHELQTVPSVFMDRFYEELTQYLEFFNLNHICSQNAVSSYLGQKYARGKGTLFKLYAKLVRFHPDYSKDILPDMMVSFPAGAITNLFKHFKQHLDTGMFRAYDYGCEENRKRYNGNNEAPSYDLANVTAPVVLCYSKHDDYINYKDVYELEKTLPNVVTSIAVERERFYHLDFLWSSEAKILVYDKLFAVEYEIEKKLRYENN